MSQYPTRIEATAEHAAALLLEYFPRGVVWSRRREGRLWQLAAGLGLELLRVRDRLLDLVDEADPRTTTDLLEAWERELDPYDCVPMPASIEERRAAVAAKFAAYGGQSATYLEEVAAAAGYEIEVVKVHPWRCGTSGVDEPLRGPEWIWTFLVYAALASPTPWRCGTHRVDEPLTDHDASPLACLIDQIKPAHGTAHFVAT